MPNFYSGQRPGLDTPVKEEAAGMLETPATATKLHSAVVLPLAEKTGKPETQFTELQERLAQRWQLARWLPRLHDAAMFLVQIGGRL